MPDFDVEERQEGRTVTLLEENTSAGSLRREDFESFVRWYAYRRVQQTGRPASEATIRHKTVALVSVARTLGCTDELSLAQQLANRAIVIRLLGTLAGRMTPGAMRAYIYVLQQYGTYAVEMGWIKQTEVYATDLPAKNPQPPITCYTDEEMKSFVAAARGRGLRWWVFISFLAETGRRVGEALALEWGWLRQSSGVTYFELPTTKNGEPQYVPLTPYLRDRVFTPENIEILKTQNKAGRAAFRRPPEKYVFPWAYGTVAAIFERFCNDLGVPDRGFHNFRHTVITNRIAAGMPLQAVSKLAGHSSTATTDRRYNHASALSYAHLLEDEEDE